MNSIEVLNQTTKYAKAYRKDAAKSIERNRHMNDILKGEFIEQSYIDAVLVDFINYIATKHRIDYGLYTKDLNSKSETP